MVLNVLALNVLTHLIPSHNLSPEICTVALRRKPAELASVSGIQDIVYLLLFDTVDINNSNLIKIT